MNVINATGLCDKKRLYGKFYVTYTLAQFVILKKNKILYLEDSLAHVCPSLANPLEGLLF